ncbi:MAG: hypothetical protein NT172_21075 [Planctomycetota bacterium]|nr:hypothetical protein [Planctomycetota bacterium]
MNPFRTSPDQAGISSLQAIFDDPPEGQKAGSSGISRPQMLRDVLQASENPQAYAEPSDHLLTCLHLILSDGSIHSFQYHHLESHSQLQYLPQGGGQRMSLVFSGRQESRVLIQGRDLITLYDYLNQHRIAWVRDISALLDFSAELPLTIALESSEP